MTAPAVQTFVQGEAARPLAFQQVRGVWTTLDPPEVGKDGTHLDAPVGTAQGLTAVGAVDNGDGTPLQPLAMTTVRPRPATP